MGANCGGSQQSRQARQPPTSSQSTSQIDPGRTTLDGTGRINQRLRAYTRASNLRMQTTVFCSEASKRVHQYHKEATPRHLFKDAGMQSSGERAGAWPDNSRPLTPNCIRSESGMTWRSRRETHCRGMEWRLWQSSATDWPQFDERHTWSPAHGSDW